MIIYQNSQTTAYSCSATVKPYCTALLSKQSPVSSFTLNRRIWGWYQPTHLALGKKANKWGSSDIVILQGRHRHWFLVMKQAYKQNLEPIYICSETIKIFKASKWWNVTNYTLLRYNSEVLYCFLTLLTVYIYLITFVPNYFEDSHCSVLLVLIIVTLWAGHWVRSQVGDCRQREDASLGQK